MRYLPFVALAAVWLVLDACTSGHATGLSMAPKGTFVREACLDFNGDHRLNGDDAADLSRVPDFNGDGKHDDFDAAFLRGLDAPLDPARQADTCENKHENIGPEFLVAYSNSHPAKVDCAKSKPAVLLFGVGGGIVNLDYKGDAAGIRSIIDGLQKSFEKQHAQTIATIAGPLMDGAVNVHTGGELWLTHAATVFLDEYPCLRILLVGHSHGAVSVDVVASHLEVAYADRIIDVVDIDRRNELYTGDTVSRPVRAHVFNIYETGDPALPGHPYDSPNAENWDATSELAPESGDEGGDLKPVNHTTIDNSEAVKQRIIAEEMTRAGM